MAVRLLECLGEAKHPQFSGPGTESCPHLELSLLHEAKRAYSRPVHVSSQRMIHPNRDAIFKPAPVKSLQTDSYIFLTSAGLPRLQYSTSVPQTIGLTTGLTTQQA